MKVIAIMRPAGYLAESVRLASSMGFSTIAAPMIDIIDKTDPDFNGFVNRIMAGEADYVIFTSANGVEYTLLKLKDPEEFIERLNKTHVVAIGPRTGNALKRNGIHVSMVPRVYSSSGLVKEFSGIEGASIEIARSTHGDPELVKGLLEKGAVVNETQVYQIICPKDERHAILFKRALAGEVDIFAFTSTMMVRNFMTLADEMGEKGAIIRIMNQKMVAAIGKPTHDTLRSYGVNVAVMPMHYTFEDMLLECKKKDC